MPDEKLIKNFYTPFLSLRHSAFLAHPSLLLIRPAAKQSMMNNKGENLIN